MGLILRSLVTCIFVTYAHGLDFRFPSDNNTCIIMKMNAAFSLSYGKVVKKLTDPVVDPSKSMCSNGSDATLALKWKDTNDTMTLTFTKGKGSEKSEMFLVYWFIPDKHFKNSTTTVLEMTSPGYKLSMSNMSYKCETPQHFKLNKTMYNLEISVADVQIQAFDVENSSFSHFEECSEDSFTTDSPASETTTHQNQTTTSPKPTPQKISIKFPNSNPCIILESAIQLNINYVDKNKTPQTAKVSITKKSLRHIKGQCAVNDTGSAYIMVSWIYRYSNFSLRMDFIADEMAKLNKMTVHAELSQDDFPDLPNKSKIVNSSSSEELFETSTLTYYMCSSSEEVKLDNTTTVVIDMIQVQAFGVKKANFTGNGTECSQDTTTTNPTTNQTHSTEKTTVTIITSKQTTATSAPMSTTAPLHPTNNYNVTEDNITCVFLVAKIDITIPYTLKNGTNASVVISVPQDFQTDGKCKEKNQTTNPLTNELNIYFFNHSWELSFVFQTENSSSQLGDMPFKTYSVKSITLLYEMNPALFPGHQDQDNGTISHFVSTNITAPLFQSKANGSYKCNVETDVPLNGSIKLEISDLQYKAFNNDNSTAFGGELSECSGDNSDNNKTNSVVPIAVGAALAGLVVIVLVAYLIGRRRNRKGYESV